MNLKTKLFLSVIAICISFLSSGQQSKIRYTGSLEAAVVKGSYEANGAISTGHGIKYKNWSVSIGTGVDYYRYRSVPVYFDIKRFMTAGNKQFFVQASAGMNIAWPTAGQKLAQRWWSSWWPNSDTLSFNNGFHSKAAIGMVLNPKDRVKAGFTLGWSYKSLSTMYYEIVSGGSGYIYAPRTTIYRMHRFYMGLNVGI
jgi:hypothetical protein